MFHLRRIRRARGKSRALIAGGAHVKRAAASACEERGAEITPGGRVEKAKMKRSGVWVVVAVVLVVAAVFLYIRQSPEGLPISLGSADEDGEFDLSAEGAFLHIPPDRRRDCRAVSGTVDERLDACLAEVSSTASSAAIERVESLVDDRGKVLSIGPIEGLSVAPLGIADIKDLRPALLGVDEERVAAMLREADVGVVVVHRDLTGAVDRDAVVLSRLANHDYLEWFRLWHVTPELMVYSVRTSASRVPVTIGERLLAGVRARMEGKPAPKQTWEPGRVQLIGTMRLQGATLLFRTSQGSNLEKVLDDLAAGMVRRWEREVQTEGFGRLEDRLADARIEVHVVMERAFVEPRSDFQLFDLWELGVDGLMFQNREGVKDRKFTYVPGSEAVAHSHRSADEFLRYAVKQFGWNDQRPWRDTRTEMEMARTEHFMERLPGGRGGAVRMYRGMPEVSMDELTDENLRLMLVDGAEWWMRNMRPDGSFNYKYWPAQNRMSTEYNEVRHILAARDLSDAWRYTGEDRYLQGARKSMDWLMKYAVYAQDKPDAKLPHPEEGAMLFRYANNQKLGTVAVALLGWVEWARAMDTRGEDANIRKMAEFVLDMQLDNGKFEPYYVPRGHPYYGQRNDIVPGEAALALGMVAELYDEPKWMEGYPKFLDFYEPWFRERAKNKQPTGRWPHDTYDNQTRLDLVQFGPWSVMASKQYYRLTGDERAAAFGLEVADWMIDNYEWTGDRSPFPDYVGGYYKLPTELPAMQSFCYSEGTAAAYEIASRFRPEAKDKYDQATRETLRFLRVMQYDDVDTYFASEPELIHGGIKYAMNENKIRIDYVGHGLSTVSQYLDARERDPAVQLTLAPWEEIREARAALEADLTQDPPR